MKRGWVVLAVVGIVLANRFAEAESVATAPAVAYHLSNMHTQPFFWDVMGSSAVGWVMGLVKGFSGTRDWILRYWPSAPPIITLLLDLFVFVVVGAYFGTGIFDPNKFVAAASAGLSWPLAFGGLTTSESDEQ